MKPFALLAAAPFLWIGAQAADDSELSDPVTSAYEQTADATSALRESAAEVATETDVWGSENYIEDEYGLYDEDFAWTTDDEWFDTWNEPDSVAWNDLDETDMDVLGNDDIGDGGLFDW